MYNSLGEYNQAKELLEKVLMITKKVFDGENHDEVAMSYNTLTSVYERRGVYTSQISSRKSTFD